MYKFILRIRINEGFQDIPFTSNALGWAIEQAEAQFGKGSYMGCINEEYIG